MRGTFYFIPAALENQNVEVEIKMGAFHRMGGAYRFRQRRPYVLAKAYWDDRGGFNDENSWRDRT
jgi:hypothetical protein